MGKVFVSLSDFAVCLQYIYLKYLHLGYTHTKVSLLIPWTVCLLNCRSFSRFRLWFSAFYFASFECLCNLSFVYVHYYQICIFKII